jgi:hypothetical protein
VAAPQPPATIATAAAQTPEDPAPAEAEATAAATDAPTSAPPAPVPSARSKIELQIVVSPRKAQATLDNKPLPRLPYTGKVPRDGKVHVLRVSAPGFTPLVKEIAFEKDLAVDLTLQKKLPEPRKAASGKASAAPAVAPEPTAAQEPAVDFPELAPKASKSARPKRSLDEESPWEDGNPKADAPNP